MSDTSENPVTPTSKPPVGAEVCIRGIVHKINFRDDVKKYYIFALRISTAKVVTCKGGMASISEGMGCQLKGIKRYDEVRMQEWLEIRESREVVDATPYGIISYLSQECPTVGPAGAEQLVQQYGLETLTVLRDSPQRVALEVSGFDLERCTKISAFLVAEASNIETKYKLYRLGLTQHQVNRLLNIYGQMAEEKIKKDCFGLIGIPGIKFLTAAKIADLVGVPRKDPQRIKAALMCAIDEVANEGHICTPASALINKAADMLEIHQSLVSEQLENLINEELLVDSERPPAVELCLDG